MNDLQVMIEDLLAAHQEAEAEKETERVAALHTKRERAAAAWATLETNIRAELPEVLRPYVTVENASDVEAMPTGWQRVVVQAPNLAPIRFRITVNNDHTPCWREWQLACADSRDLAGWNYARIVTINEFTPQFLMGVITKAAVEWSAIQAIKDEKAAEKARKEAYEEAYAAYLQEKERVEVANRELITSVQQLIDQTFGYGKTWTLHYGVTAEEEGEIFATTNEVEVMQPEPERGLWLVVAGNGGVMPTRFFAPAYIDQEPTVRDGAYYRAKYNTGLSLPGEPLLYPPYTDVLKVRRLVDDALKGKVAPKPTPPDAKVFGYNLDNWWETDEVRSIQNRLEFEDSW